MKKRIALWMAICLIALLAAACGVILVIGLVQGVPALLAGLGV